MKLKLTQEHIDYILTKEDSSKKKDVIQDIGIDYFKESGYNMICTWATSVGKTIFACKIIQKIRERRSDEIHVCVPYESLKEQWEGVLNSFKIQNVKVFIINSYSKKTFIPYLLIVDECHYMIANPETKASIINDYPIKYKLYLSATLKAEQLRYLSTKGLKNNFEITLKEAGLLDLIPSYNVYNVYVDLTETEKRDYAKQFERFNKHMDYFKKFNIQSLPKYLPKIPGEDEAVIKGNYYNALGARSKYIGIIHNAALKLDVIKKLLPSLENRKTIFFSKSVKTAIAIAKLGDMPIYHSNQTKQAGAYNLNLFLENKKNWISSVLKLIAGLDDVKTDTLVRFSFDSVSHAGIQSLGRLLRIDSGDPDKHSIAINLVCRPYDDIIPSDNYWVQISNKGLLTKWVEIDELLEILNQC